VYCQDVVQGLLFWAELLNSQSLAEKNQAVYSPLARMQAYMAEQDQQRPRSPTRGYAPAAAAAPIHKVWGEVESTSTSSCSNVDDVGRDGEEFIYRRAARIKMKNIPLRALESSATSRHGSKSSQERVPEQPIDFCPSEGSSSTGIKGSTKESEEDIREDEIPEERERVSAKAPSRTHNVGPADDPQNISIGSAGHYEGMCRPCAWFIKAGCFKGKDCGYCHLCGEGVCQQRRKERHVHANQKRRSARAARAKDAATSSGSVLQL